MASELAREWRNWGSKEATLTLEKEGSEFSVKAYRGLKEDASNPRFQKKYKNLLLAKTAFAVMTDLFYQDELKI